MNYSAKQFPPSAKIERYAAHAPFHALQMYHQRAARRPEPYARPADEPIDLTRRRPREERKRPRLPAHLQEVIELQITQAKQAEIVKAAKSLFSKRTRTLYHWMYPSTPKQQIKAAVLNLWENLSGQEKQFYISQVLVKFGFPQCNLMVNPQLGGIKELPPLPDTFENNFAAKELQTAISSISEAGGGAAEMKRRQGRPPGSKNKKKEAGGGFKLGRDFQDDPELSKELEKFATSFDYFK